MSVAVYYLQLLPIIREKARLHGYAVGLHGSMMRDFDLIAVPWSEIASPPDVLCQGIKDAIHGEWSVNNAERPGHRLHNPSRKPHGRLAWSIMLGGGAYVDLSVMPPPEPKE